MGKEFCAKKKFQEDSVVAVDIQEARKEAAIGALNKVHTTGVCDPSALGQDFCKKHREKWLITPNGVPGEQKNSAKTPLLPAKTGNLPRLNPKNEDIRNSDPSIVDNHSFISI